MTKTTWLTGLALIGAVARADDILVEHFDQAPFSSPDRWVTRDGSCNAVTGGVDWIVDSPSDGCGHSPRNLVRRTVSGIRCITYPGPGAAPFSTTGFVNVHLTFSYWLDAGASNRITCAVFSNGSWMTDIADLGATGGWLTHTVPLPQNVTGIRFRFVGNTARRLDCIRIFGDRDCDGDGTGDPADPDDDNDGRPDVSDPAPCEPFACGNEDGDTCDDCGIIGFVSPFNDGPDCEGDGICDSSDGDDDGDGRPDSGDPATCDRFVCGNQDGDVCDDCGITASVSPFNDGPDCDADGTCDSSEIDDDGDSRPDSVDSAPCNHFICSDVDDDLCDDCSGGLFNPGSDGPDFDMDVICNAGDNCPNIPNPGQEDCDFDGTGSACESDCQSNGTADDCEIVLGTSSDCQPDGFPDACEIASGSSQDCDGNNVPDECQSPGIPAARVIGASTRKNHAGGVGPDDIIVNILGAVQDDDVTSESRVGGINDLRISFDVAPGGPGPAPIVILEQSCPACPCAAGTQAAYVTYTGSSVYGASISGNELVLKFTPALESPRTYKFVIGPSISSTLCQSIEIRALVGDVNSDGVVNATDRSVLVGVWTGSGYSSSTDADQSGRTNATDRSIVVGTWTGGQNCAP